MECKRCGNTDDLYFYNDRGIYYCRKCVAFGRMNVEDIPKKYISNIKPKEYIEYPHFKFTLTSYQLHVIEQMLESLNNHIDVFIYAATGAGKTEIATMAIYHYLKNKKKVGFAISRRQVVLEIQERLQNSFPSLQVIAVCEGYTEVMDADIIVCTMHQLYRYHQAFDLLVMDEMDAFPYRGNPVLNKIALHSCIGERLYLSATPDTEIMKEVKNGNIDMYELFMRPHGKDLVVPKIIQVPVIMQYLYLFKVLHNKKNKHIQTLIFVPTISLCENLYFIFKNIFKCNYLTSQSIYKDEIINQFKQNIYDFLFTTTVLERGITIKGVDVIVLHSDHQVFHEASLIQIAGRVGRNMEKSSGEVLFLCKQKNRSINTCITNIERMNASKNE